MTAEEIQALEDSQPEIQELTLQNLAYKNFHKYLSELPSLQCLALKELLTLTGKFLATYSLV